MQLTEKQIDLLNRRKNVILTTANLQGKPRSIFVEANKAEGDKIIITDNVMVTTRKNLLENKQVAIVAFEEDYSYYLKISGKAEYHTSGEYFDWVRGLETNKNYSPKGAVVVTVEEVVEVK